MKRIVGDESCEDWIGKAGIVLVFSTSSLANSRIEDALFGYLRGQLGEDVALVLSVTVNEHALRVE